MDKVVIKTEKRNDTSAKVLRRGGSLPGIVYSKGKEGVSLSMDRVEFEKCYREAGTSQIVSLKIADEGTKNVLVHKVDWHPVTGLPQHVDFYEVSMKEKITTEVPLSFIGDSVAVIEMGGTLVTNRDNLEIECLPGDLPHEIEVDVAPLVDFEATIHVKDIKLPSSVEVKNDPEEMVVTVEPPRSEEELAELDEEIETPDLPEAEQGGETGEEEEQKEEE